MSLRKSRLSLAIALASFAAASPVWAASAWVEQGPGPIAGGQVENLPPCAGSPVVCANPVAGAIEAVVPDPSSADVIYVGTVNGGIWKTANATTTDPSGPSWTPLTDQQLPALSINSLAISPLSSNTLFAGTGSVSSDGGEGSPGFGLARSNDGGSNWTILAASTFTGRAIDSVVPTTLNGGDVVLASILATGLYRSTDGGTSFQKLSGATGSGLPVGGVSQLIADPGNANRFYAGVPQKFIGSGATPGVYRSDDGGATWTLKSSGLAGLSTSQRILLAVHNDASNNVVFAAVIASNGSLGGVFRSTNQGQSWASLGVPSPAIFPGNQGNIHGAIAADPNSPTVVFIGGDRQANPFPNANGCTDFVGNVWRGDASPPSGTPTWQSVVCSGANNTAPHADTRALVFDANGNLLEGCDGGIYLLADPDNLANSRQWASEIGSIRPTELHSAAYDPLAQVLVGGAQDNGAAYQSAPGSPIWSELLVGDGGNVAVTPAPGQPGSTARYTSTFQFGNFNYSIWNAANQRVGNAHFILLQIAGTSPIQTLFQLEVDSKGNSTLPFYAPFAINAIAPNRMLIGATRLYESADQGDNLNVLLQTASTIGANSYGQPLAYGGRLNGVGRPDIIYAGAGNRIYHRILLGTTPVNLPNYAAAGGGAVITIALNPRNYRQVFVLDANNQVWLSPDEGNSWRNLTSNLGTLSGQIDSLAVFSPDATLRHTIVIAGGFGVFELRRPGIIPHQWVPLSTGLPNALVEDLRYDAQDDVLVASTLGRGAWTLTGFFRGGGGPIAALSLPAPAPIGGYSLGLPTSPPIAAPPHERRTRH